MVTARDGTRRGPARAGGRRASYPPWRWMSRPSSDRSGSCWRPSGTSSWLGRGGACGSSARVDRRARQALPGPSPGLRRAAGRRRVGRSRSRRPGRREHARRPPLARRARTDARRPAVREHRDRRRPGHRARPRPPLPPVRGSVGFDPRRRRDDRPVDGDGPPGDRARSEGAAGHLRGDGADLARRRRRWRRWQPVPAPASFERSTLDGARLADRGERRRPRDAARLDRGDAPGPARGVAGRDGSRPTRAVGLPLRGRRRGAQARSADPAGALARGQRRVPRQPRGGSPRPRDRVRRPPATRPTADPRRVHARDGRLGGGPAGRRTVDASTTLGLRHVCGRRTREPPRAAPRERPRAPHGRHPLGPGVP